MERRNNIQIWMVFLAFAFFVGCSNEVEDMPLEDTYIKILPSISQSRTARLSGSNFESEDKIGIYVIPYQENNTIPGYFPTDAHASNIEYRYNGVNWASVTNAPKWPGTDNADVYGYYPYDAELDSKAATGIYEFSVQTDQRTHANFAQSDFLWGKAGGLSPTRSVQLTFYHQMTQVSINVVSQLNDSAEDAEMEVSLVNAIYEAFIEMTYGEVYTDIPLPTANIQTMSLQTTEEGYDGSFRAIVPPQVIGKGSRFIKVIYNGTSYYYYPPEDLVLESGKHTTFNIAITNQGLIVRIITINEWQDGGTFDDSLNEKAPWILDLNAIDWDQSLVHNVIKNGIPVARVCKEYLFTTSTVDAQAIVVYPIDTEGKSIVTKGFVAQVMNRDRNSITGVYEPNTSNVHGGLANFSSSLNTLQSYTAGTSALINKIEVDGNGNIIPAPNNAIPLLTTQPILVTDADNNNYPVVKIGTQYWTAKNYQAEHYADGTQLTCYYYNNDKNNKSDLGALYTWNTITNTHGIAPTGWAVPTRDEWVVLEKYLGTGGGKKLRTFTMWNSLNYGDNITGFSGIPAGQRTTNGDSSLLNTEGLIWSSSIYTTTKAYSLQLYNGDIIKYIMSDRGYAYSIRLLRKTPL